ncbi:MAG: LysM peptidoglycan-binding domain-containing protein [Syntrophomonadaceae bacterium]|nr:LysM peptidoglycan-binding domain-containing protein [Syntrophomonadaceae bacterium]
MKKRFLIIAGLAALTILIAAVSLNAYQKNDVRESRDAFKVSLDGKTWFFVEDKLKLEDLLDDYKNQYISEVDKDVQIIKAGFKQKLDIVEVNDFQGDLCSPREAEKIIRSHAEAARVIEVRDGDNIWSIAMNNQLSVEEIGKLNPHLDEEMRIYPGDKLTITAEKPILAACVNNRV